MNKKTFLSAVVQHIRSKEAKESVKAELEHHIHESSDRLIKKGYSKNEAEHLAVQQMGNPSSLGIEFKKLYRPKIEWRLICLFLIVLGLGYLPLIILKDVDVGFSQDLSITSLKRSIYVLMGILIAIILCIFNYRKWQRYAWYFFGVGTLILIVANSGDLFESFIITINGRPFFDFIVFTVDTSIALPFFLIAWASIVNNLKVKFWKLCMFIFISTFLYMNTINISLFMMYLFMLLLMYLNSNRTHKIKIVMVSLCSGVLAFLTIKNMKFYNITDITDRIMGLLQPENDPNGAGYTYIQIKMLLSQTTWGFQPITDEIYFSIPWLYSELVLLFLTYTFGWGFAVLLLVILTLIIVNIAFIATQVADPFGKQLIIGAATIYAFQLFYNVGMSFGFLPLAGISLPFISYGNAPIFINAIMIGIVLSVYRRKDLVANMDKKSNPSLSR
ncbi:FtsW/RodA/SpoVE family cell cycle protein [Chengkuizengella axinellae]|uniref:FtsW/RodA/SpoVE family cell cycle protein n=1 Tax=Chengkuizengella axinellae TaxID=3064388 RepID=A0ABT9IZS9_9BACL|nr:FtsW/RodA/SpoVE family cell cycle protein [Chengkuizengella sp. 2205SS18-9]MDP5274879.1 FtsW/RodA/SpoVE family cell cycle protein [Chengkuizengella sp. 2205SS18-9]